MFQDVGWMSYWCLSMIKILTVDGVGAYDHVFWLRCWGGCIRCQGHLFSIEGALEEVPAALLLGEQLCAFLDDVYLLCDPLRVKVLHVGGSIVPSRIQLHQGKNQSLEPSRDPTRGHRAWGKRVQTCWNHGWAHPSGRNASRRRWKNTSRKKGPCGKPSTVPDLHDAHNATRVHCLVLSDTR